MKHSVAILGDYSRDFAPHACTDAAIEHSNRACGLNVEAHWIPTEKIDRGVFENHGGIWIAPGSPYKDMAKVLWAIRQARETGVPCLGTCGGVQHMILEYARNVLGFKDAQHAEYDPYGSELFISRMECSLANREMRLEFAAGSGVARAYGSLTAVERYYCNFAVDPDRVEILKSGPLAVVGSDAEGEIRVVELPEHPFFIGTLFVPQVRSTAAEPHPLVTAFLRAVAQSHT